MSYTSWTCKMMNMKTEQHENFVRRLQLIQDQTGWNLSEIARRVMVSPQAVQQWAKGDTTPRGERLKRLAAVTGNLNIGFSCHLMQMNRVILYLKFQPQAAGICWMTKKRLFWLFSTRCQKQRKPPHCPCQSHSTRA